MDRAHADGLLERLPGTADRRRRVVLLTPKGAQAREALLGRHRVLARRGAAPIGQAQELLARETQRLRNAGLSESGELRIGHPAEEIVRAAEQLDSDCVIVGSHGMSGVKRFLLGSVSDHVLQYAPCSVLIVKKLATAGDESGQGAAPAEAGRTQALRMLLAYDRSVPASEAVEFCASLPLDERAEVTVLTVLPLITLYRQDIRQRLSWFWQEQKKQAVAALEEVKKAIGRATPHVEAQLRESADVSDAILDAAAEYDLAALEAVYNDALALYPLFSHSFVR